MSTARLRPLPFDHRAVKLTPEEGYVFSRLDRPVLRSAIPALVGMPPEKAEAIVARLLAAGVLAVDGEVAATGAERPPSGSRAVAPGAERRPSAAGAVPRSGTPPPASPRRRPSSPAPEAEGRASWCGPLRESEPPGSIPQEAVAARELYGQAFRGLTPSARAAKAQHATGQELLALCHDPHPQVVLALLANAGFGPLQARIVAHFHQNATGLDLLARHGELLRDPDVQRALLGNPRLTPSLAERVHAAASLDALYQHASDPALPAEVRRALGPVLRARFDAATPRERADLVYWSEGKALAFVEGAPLDAETAAALGRRAITSTELVLRLASHPGTPRSLLVALDQQPLVAGRRDLRELIRRHPNAR